MRRKNCSLSILFLTLVVFTEIQAAPQNQETESTVAELTAFHEIIYPIWHTAYPDKDGAALRSYAPEVKRLADKVLAAKLPGILHEKQAKWDQGLEEFKKSVDAYLAAAAGTDDAALLSAAEALHAHYEMMVRIIRPVLKEVDDFHKVLYVIYHRYLPEKNYEMIKQSCGDLIAKAEAITKASLPKRLEAKTDNFHTAAAELYESVKALDETARCGQDDAIAAAVEKMHTKYQNLEKVFD